LQDHLEEIRAYAELCKLFGTPFIRVFGGGIGSAPREEAVQTAAAHFREMAKIAEAFGVKLLLETHDDWTDCRDTRSLMEAVDSNAVGVLWDVHHPYRMIGEQPETTWETLGKWIAYTHVKDSLPIEPAPGAKHPFRYCLTGEGDIPLKRICGLLKQQGYEGYYTLEWEKKWHPEIAEADIAFPQYVSYMRRLAAELNG
jgi:sugar phosphate isomerase/epimerase